MRVGAKAGLPPENFAFAQTLYGDLDGALKAVAAMSDPVRRTNRFTDVAGILWRMRDRVNAATVLEFGNQLTLRAQQLDPGNPRWRKLKR